MIRDVDIGSVTPILTPWTNWAQNQAGGAFRIDPTSIFELVAAVRYAEHQNSRIKAVGSSWSFTGVAKPDRYWVSLNNLDRILPTEMPALIRRDLEADEFVHVEAGIKLHDLNESLWAARKALSTLGGSQGQSLAGAISTGTHGSDFDRAPIADAVRAIHLVGNQGQEYWIEPGGNNRITDGDQLAIPNWFDGIEIIRSDEVFNAALVSMGRCGIVYSYVIEVEPRYRLEEERYNALWTGQVGGDLEVIRDTLSRAAGDFQNAWRNDRSPLGSSSPLRYVQIDIDPNGVEAAYVTKRWLAQEQSHVDDPPSNPTTFDRDAHFIGWTASNLWWMSDHFYLDRVREAFGNNRYPRTARDRGYYIMSGRPDPYANYAAQYDAFQQHAWRVSSMEFFFDANDVRYLSFIDELKQAWNSSGGRKVGYFSIRFMGMSRATLAMQRWPTTVSIECCVFNGYPGTDRGVQAAFDLGTRYGAVFHWGQLTPPDYGAFLPSRYGHAIEDWRGAIRRLGVRPGDTFSTNYSRNHTLEPSRTRDGLLLFANGQ